MNGELVSGGRENLRVLIDYKGSGFPGGQMQDDLLLFSLRPDASPNPLALAIVNFPPIRGKRSLYIHRLSGEAPEDRDVLLDAIEAFARRQSPRLAFAESGIRRLGFFKAFSSQIALAPAREITISDRANRSASSCLIYSYCTYPFVSLRLSSIFPLPHRWIT